MFEVTYVGQHTCSSTSQTRSRSRKLKTPETLTKEFETRPMEEAALLPPDHFPSPETVKLDNIGSDELATHGEHHQIQATVVACDKSWTDRLRDTLGESATRSTSDEQSQEEEEEEEEDEEDEGQDKEGRRPSVTSNLTCLDTDAVEPSFNLSDSMANMAIPPRPSTSEELHYHDHDIMQGGHDELLVHESSQHYGFHQDHMLWSSLMEPPSPIADPKP